LPDADIDRVRVQRSRDVALLNATVREAGELALSMFRTDLRRWTKGVSSPVSEADIAVDELIRSRLQGATPEYGWLSEESVDDETRLMRDLVWIVDPIDGTRSFLEHRNDWGVSVALVERGESIAGAFFAPATDEFFAAVRGEGATLNGHQVMAKSGSDLDFSRMAGPRPLIEKLGLQPDGGATHPRIGSLALRMCRVAEGRIDAAFATGNSKDWDLAAADLIVQEAGGRLTAIGGEALIFNRPSVTHGLLVAAGRDRHTAIIEYFRNNPSF